MTVGDNLFGIKTVYKGILMRSKLETKVAYFLDCLKIKWEYEPQGFLLSNGVMYLPDFYLPELKMWIEVKGLIKEHNREYSRLFAKEAKTEILIISSNRMFWVSAKDFVDGLNEDRDVQLSLCSHCQKYFFSSPMGDWKCRSCNAHEGDHDIIGEFLYDENYYFNLRDNSHGEGRIDFSNLNSIKGWLHGAKTGV